ncbi:hypothetical protein CHUAL_003990 [Chamberlinius hualienensis]
MEVDGDDGVLGSEEREKTSVGDGLDSNDHAENSIAASSTAKSTVKMPSSGEKKSEDEKTSGSTPNGDLKEGNVQEVKEEDDEKCKEIAEEKTESTTTDANKSGEEKMIEEVKSVNNNVTDKDEDKMEVVEDDCDDVGDENEKSVERSSKKVEKVEKEDGDDDKVEVIHNELEIRMRAEENEQKEVEIMEKLRKNGEPSDTKGGKDQTIIITETKSLVKAINEAVRKPDGKPTLVIIESKSNNSPSNNSNSTTPPGSKSNKVSNSPSTGMTLRSRSRMEAQGSSSSSHHSSTPPKSQRKAAENANVALKDDADINIYTPSLMVPYLYECSPKENLADFLLKIGAKKSESAKEKTEGTGDDIVENGEKPKKEKTFFDTTLGSYFIDIGLLQAQKWVQTEVLRVEKRKLDKGWSTKERKSMVFNLKKTLEDINKQIHFYEFDLKTCTRCNFKTESQVVLDRHLETIHVNGNRMICSYCDYDTTEPSQIFQHLYNSHKAFGRLDRPPALHQCPLCPIEDSAKARVTRHVFKCTKNFVPDKNQAPSNDFEPPAKRVRHVATVATLKAMRAGVSVDKMSSAAAVTSSQVYQMQQNRNAAAANAAARAQPAPIRPKPGDIRLSPAYVQSVLRGQYMSSQNVRGMTTQGLVSGTQGSLVRPQRNSQQTTSTTTGAAYMLRQSNPVITSINTLTNPLQASQLFQVINPSAAGGLVPLVRSGTIGGINAQRFTILPTPPVTVNNRGPTPVALIPNMATTSKTTSALPNSLTSVGSIQQLRSNQNANHGGGGGAGKGGSQKPNISITPVSKPMNKFNLASAVAKIPTATGSASSGSSNSANRSNQNQSQQQGNSMYVVCEICDGYIKDLDQLRNHMQWIHKVKIHPKMIHNRPPLNCQKCHYRFFTDQGLERHLLGSHGLVTSSMQENANKGKDGGRCIICGKVFLWKLVVHMAKDHKMTLKPAHLSYKCTVCSATFNMYRLFETHVYDEHSTVAKRVLDGQKNLSSAANAHQATSGVSQVGKPKVNTPSHQGNSTQNQPVTRRSEAIKPTLTTASTISPVAAAAVKPATSRITLHPEPRVCDECGATFKRGGNCDRHWEPTKLKPCNANICRVDKCDTCLEKFVASKGSNASSSVNTTSHTSNTTTKSPHRMSQKSAANGKSVIQTDKLNNKDKIASSKVQQPEKSQTTTTTTVSQPTKTQQSQSDGEDVFDMEVETVDENGSSPGYGRSDVESD